MVDQDGDNGDRTVAPDRRPNTMDRFADVEGLVRTEQLNDRMGIVVTDWTPDRLVATMPVKDNRQPYGLLHGGASCVLAEALGSIAAAMHAGPERAAVGIEINATHHRAVRDGLVTAVCTPVHAGRTLASYEVAISDEQGARVCTARLTCILRPSAPARQHS
ncbi:MAG TPA: hotdog fold thioesterase [Mycobacteriales bacterium]|nr:hotdog fold thioesterase [Mycobacteriales bacterium]